MSAIAFDIPVDASKKNARFVAVLHGTSPATVESVYPPRTYTSLPRTAPAALIGAPRLGDTTSLAVSKTSAATDLKFSGSRPPNVQISGSLTNAPLMKPPEVATVVRASRPPVSGLQTPPKAQTLWVVSYGHAEL